MRKLSDALSVICAVVAVAVLLLLWLAASGGALILLWILLMQVVFALFQYRHARQDELVNVLAMAAESQLPLAPAVRAYLKDRPQGNLREFWVTLLWLLLLLIFPVFYLNWRRGRQYDRKVERLCEQLDQGVKLDRAFEGIPGVVPAVTVLAAGIGRSTGRLSECLRWSTRQRTSRIWTEIVGPLIYQWLTVIMTLTVAPVMVAGLLHFIVPQFRKIFSDFGMPLPAVTVRYLGFAHLMVNYGALVILGVLLIAVAVWRSTTLLWVFPGFGYVYRSHTRARVLQMLGMLFGAAKPVPEALGLLAGLPMGTAVRWRLEEAKWQAERGQPLGESLRQAGLLTSSMAPLIRSAERAGHLPWVLAELGESLSRRAVRRAQQIVAVMLPVCVIAVGAFVGITVVALFLPLIELISSMS